jgi:antiviral helicase SKI2
MKAKDLLPTVVFTFSKRKCEEYANGLGNLDLTTAAEKSQIHLFFEKALLRLKGTDKELPQILRAKETCTRGIAVHHGGLLPIMKEVRYGLSLYPGL